MRIAIITLSVNTNYGGILQAYALQTILEKMGHEVNLLMQDHTIRISKKLVLFEIPKRLFANLRGVKTELFPEFRYNIEYRCATKDSRLFIKKYLNINKKNLWLLKQDDYDAYVVGSDQIWRPFYCFGSKIRFEDTYLKFTKDWPVVRISYAASFGTSEWEYSTEETEIAKNLVKRFNAVSVREQSAVALCREHLDVSAEWSLDPTLLLQREDYEKFIEDKDVRKGSAFAYILDKSEIKTEIVDTICKDRGLQPFSMYVSMDDPSVPMKDKRDGAVKNWLENLCKADFVVTDSYHGCVFSIIFNKPFVVIANKKRGLSRFESLLGSFGMMNHLITGLDEYDPQCSYAIPDATYETVETERAKSIGYLKRNLNIV